MGDHAVMLLAFGGSHSVGAMLGEAIRDFMIVGLDRLAIGQISYRLPILK